MKYVPNRLFGYPVLDDESLETADYPNKLITPKINLILNSEDITKYTVKYELTLNSSTLNKLINEKKANYVIRVSCNASLFSQSEICGANGSFDILGDNLREKIEISVFLVASESLTLKSQNNEFHPDFEGEEFCISKGMVLAYPAPVVYFISKENFMDVTSIFEWKRKPNQKNGTFDVGISDQKIEIISSEAQTKIFKDWMRRNDSKYIAYNSIFLSALTHAIEHLKNDPDSYSDNRWANIILTKCENKDIDIEKKSALEISQRLLNSPLELLNKIISSNGE